MTLSQQMLESDIPDLRDIPVDRLAETGGTVLANAVDLYLRRREEAGAPLNSFSSSI